eukprot:12294382-Alexandrium_andersonii.AAC.1
MRPGGVAPRSAAWSPWADLPNGPGAARGGPGPPGPNSAARRAVGAGGRALRTADGHPPASLARWANA